jgi:hypothetical protein
MKRISKEQAKIMHDGILSMLSTHKKLVKETIKKTKNNFQRFRIYEDEKGRRHGELFGVRFVVSVRCPKCKEVYTEGDKHVCNKKTR